MWKYCAKKTNDISLHDCRVTKVSLEHQDLYFDFPEGFWIAANTENNSKNITLSTDASQLKIVNYELSEFYVFKEIRLFRKLICTQRVSIEMKTLIDNMNSGEWELEFLYEYHTYREVLFTCWIWSKRKPYHRECQLMFTYDDIDCYWNKLCEDKPW